MSCAGDGCPALAAARHAQVPRVPFVVLGRTVGSVAQAHLPALAPFAAALRVDGHRVELIGEDPGQALAPINLALRAQGLVRAWRDERFALFDPATLDVLGTLERAAARFWGLLTLGAHATGYVRDDEGRVQALWIAQRSATKATDPGLHDNMVGGGVGAGQTPHAALVREAFEEAGLHPRQLEQARPGSVLRLHRDIAEGFQHEWLHAFDIELDADVVPVNQDGEVAGFEKLPVAAAHALACSGRMTVDAAIVTLDFLDRHRCLADRSASPSLRQGLAQALEGLRIAAAPTANGVLGPQA